MKKFEINVQEPYLSFILSGKKTVEGRLNKGKFKEIEVGDILIINDKKEFEIVAKDEYKSFSEMIEDKGVDVVVPDKQILKDAVNVSYRFYTKEQEEEFGVVAITVSSLSR